MNCLRAGSFWDGIGPPRLRSGSITDCARSADITSLRRVSRTRSWLRLPRTIVVPISGADVDAFHLCHRATIFQPFAQTKAYLSPIRAQIVGRRSPAVWFYRTFTWRVVASDARLVRSPPQTHNRPTWESQPCHFHTDIIKARTHDQLTHGSEDTAARGTKQRGCRHDSIKLHLCVTCDVNSVAIVP